jgi:MIP family channel proteins
MVQSGPGQEPDRSGNDVTIYNLFGYDYTPADNHAAFGEFVATTLFVYVGCGVAVSTQAFSAFDPDTKLDNDFLLAVSIAFGFAISILAYSVAPISGGHINPAVSFAFFILKDLPLIDFISYLFAQCCGATLGAALVWGSFASPKLEDASESSPPYLVGSNFVHQEIPLGSAFLGEMMGTFLLVWTVLMTAVSVHSIAGNLAPIAIGWSVMLAHMLLIPITTCGINPARSFGPHMISIMAGEEVGARGWWIFYTAPFVGAGLAAMVCKYVFGVMKEEEHGTDEEKATIIIPEEDDDIEKKQPLWTHLSQLGTSNTPALVSNDGENEA